MMGSGKTTVGRRVAKRLGRPFVDADEELERRSGRSVRDWFESEGEDGFRDAEAALLVDLLTAEQPTVIACGGGVVDAGPGTEQPSWRPSWSGSTATRPSWPAVWRSSTAR